MGAPDWTPEEDEWLREEYPLYSNAELAAFKALDGWPRDEQAICRRARKLKLRKDPSRGYVRTCRTATIWTPERDAWFRAYVPGHIEGEISAEHERIWGFPLTESQIANRKTKLGVRSGTHGGRFEKGSVPHNKGKTWDEMGISAESQERMRRTTFKRGNHPHNEGELLDERLAEHNVWQVKVDPRDAKNPTSYWVSRARFNWERENGPWPEGCRALHVDGDPANDAAENILPVENALWPLVCGTNPSALPFHDRETAEAAVLSARISRRRAELARESRAARGRPWKQDAERASE